jgi:hypothetical protein
MDILTYPKITKVVLGVWIPDAYPILLREEALGAAGSRATVSSSLAQSLKLQPH